MLIFFFLLVSSVNSFTRTTTPGRGNQFSFLKMTSALEVNTLGDYTKVKFSLLDNGEPIDTPFDQGENQFVIGGGGYAHYIHQLAEKLTPGQSMQDFIWSGSYNENLAADIPIANAPPGLALGDVVKLSNGLRARVTDVTSEKIRIDANPALAGKTLQLDMTCLERYPAKDLKQATFAAGCFWGLELAFQRMPGVAFTACGYTQGMQPSPSYDAVCSGSTGHAEAVTVLFDPSRCSFESLLRTFWGRHDPTQKDSQGGDTGTQYRGGVYYHSLEQKIEAEASMVVVQTKYSDPLATELLPANTFWMAEDYHQQYLEKGGQSAKKTASEKIRCYG